MGFVPYTEPSATPVPALAPSRQVMDGSGGGFVPYAPPQQDNPSQGQQLPGAFSGAEDFDFLGSAKRTASTVYDKYIKHQVLPTALSAAATAIPALAAPVTAAKGVSLALPIIGEGLYQGVAAMGGEYLNQQLGVTPESTGDIKRQGIVQALLSSAAKGVQMGRPFAGRSGNGLVNDLGATEARRLVQSYTPTESSASLFAKIQGDVGRIPMEQTQQALDGFVINPRDTPKFTWGEAASDIAKIQSELSRSHDWTPARWQQLHSAIGQSIGAYSGSSKTKGLGELKKIYSSMFEDIERAAANETEARNTGIVTGGSEPRGRSQGGADISSPTLSPLPEPPLPKSPLPDSVNLLPAVAPKGGQSSASAAVPGSSTEGAMETFASSDLLKALRIYKREQVVDTLAKNVEGATKTLRGQGENVQFNASEVLQKIKNNPYYKQTFSETEQRDIRQTLELLNTIPPLGSAKGMDVATLPLVRKVALATMGGQAAHAAGASTGASAAIAAGSYAIPMITDFSRNLSFALNTKAGRDMIRELSKTPDGLFTPRNFSILSAYVSANKREPDSEMFQPANNVKRIASELSP